jgi:hypothetical protein
MNDINEDQASGFPDFPLEDWKMDVQNGDTFLGYTDWVKHNIESKGEPYSKLELEILYEGKAYDSVEVTLEYVLTRFLEPYVFVTRKSDGAKGSMSYQNEPRIYYDFIEGKTTPIVFPE